MRPGLDPAAQSQIQLRSPGGTPSCRSLSPTNSPELGLLDLVAARNVLENLIQLQGARGTRFTVYPSLNRMCSASRCCCHQTQEPSDHPRPSSLTLPHQVSFQDMARGCKRLQEALISKGLSEGATFHPLHGTDSVTHPCHTARWAGRCCLQLTLPRGTAKGQSRDWGHCGVGHSDPDPRLDIPCSPRALLTFILLHTDSGVGEDTGVSFQCVVVGAVIILILEGAVLTSLLCRERGQGCEVTRTRKALGGSPVCTPTRSRACRTHHMWLCPALLLMLPFFISSTIWIWRWQELQFPFRLPVPQVWQRTQSRMLSHTAWKPWAEGGGMVRNSPRSGGGHSL